MTLPIFDPRDEPRHCAICGTKRLPRVLGNHRGAHAEWICVACLPQTFDPPQPRPTRWLVEAWLRPDYRVYSDTIDADGPDTAAIKAAAILADRGTAYHYVAVAPGHYPTTEPL